MKCFIIMPFRPEFTPVFETVKRALADAQVSESIRMDEIRSAGRITVDMQSELHAADFCIADLTDLNPNVMWETGYAGALLKPTIVISQAIERLPFDIHDVRVERYTLDNLAELRKNLVEAITHTMRRYALHRIALPPRSVRTLAITGSMSASPERVLRRLETLLPPFFGDDTTWYCGTAGNSDEVAAEFLLNAKQRVIAVGYAQLDVSSRMLKILDKYNAPFVDASREQLLRIPGAPTDRDILFAQKSDIVALFWDGKSQGIRQIADWLTAQNQSHMLVFV